jgi:hypothetical protein
MKYPVEMCSSVVKYTPSFIEIYLRQLKVDTAEFKDIQTARRTHELSFIV